MAQQHQDVVGAVISWEVKQCAVVQELDDFCKKSKSEAEKEQKKVGKLITCAG